MPRKLISEKSDERNGERKISDPDELNFNGESSDGATTYPEGDDKISDECLDFIIYLRVHLFYFRLHKWVIKDLLYTDKTQISKMKNERPDERIFI